ncbi:DUF3311 domain-containing protein [Clostridium luticellarii]|jgi:hypothetical protein|uniref:DUF3311 domain-containing protein n=1 Tax=Clostridium luticellarii TaxID=1691940 RepID=A0A2T0BSK9_9CLOT|nr:DUF3311 domain-containing protein [Clostridium luticellarii]MCI1945645.1 DUF3311 domain-containing protein [Clostridium luticellarii]MCI1968462.1 DUF3311 domain-containing protein [Clostridium luticellarii]MCI1996521.1 DUF3311 domain-containing protein [Clostridium luticellarii]MCI2039856.1 DUF3311 domain-containing protein [Clostridium luticellarii]PRR86853.1 hypothetical protein CLLU_00190 [Clostridium luticellarii]
MKLIKVILFIIPFIWSVFAIPFVNRVDPFVLGLPFLAFWELMGVFVATICIAVMYHLDFKNENLDKKNQ